MGLADWAVRVAVTPFGAALDRVCVEHLGHSPVSWLFARGDGIAYNPPILVETVGRKSGKPRTVVLPGFEAGGGRLAVVGSKGGAPADPHWARNLRVNGNVRICVSRRWRSGQAALAEGTHREALWKDITGQAPVYLAYQERAAAHREIPVFVIEEAADASG